MTPHATAVLYSLSERLAQSAHIVPPIVVDEGPMGLSVAVEDAGRGVVILPRGTLDARIGVLAHEIAHLQYAAHPSTSREIWRATSPLISLIATATGLIAAVLTAWDSWAVLMVAATGATLWTLAHHLTDHADEIRADRQAITLLDMTTGDDGAGYVNDALTEALTHPTTWHNRLLLRHRQHATRTRRSAHACST